MTATTSAAKWWRWLAIKRGEPVWRAGPQAAKLWRGGGGGASSSTTAAHGRTGLDGAWSARPAGSTAYNYSAHGPILPIDGDVLAITAVAAFRPGALGAGALLPNTAVVCAIEVSEPGKRPVMADATAGGRRRRHGRDPVQPEIVHRICSIRPRAGGTAAGPRAIRLTPAAGPSGRRGVGVSPLEQGLEECSTFNPIRFGGVMSDDKQDGAAPAARSITGSQARKAGIRGNQAAADGPDLGRRCRGVA